MGGLFQTLRFRAPSDTIALMVIASHVIFTTYGFWLPNDPRGSWSDFVRSWEVLRFGQATKTTARRSLARDTHDIATRLKAKEALCYPPVKFTGRQALSVAEGFAFAIERSQYGVYACSILPDHVHMVVARHRYGAEQIVRRLKQAGTLRLTADGLHPLGAWRTATGKPPTPWVRRCWTVFLDDDRAVRRAIGYAEANPSREGKPPQRWSFVTPYGG